MSGQINILAIESSCDETSVSLLRNNEIVSNKILSQEYHKTFGGVVPEIASREHLRSIVTLTQSALESAGIEKSDIDIIAAANEPGLIGALLIGLNFAKSLALSLGKPFIPVNHIQAHLYSPFINEDKPEFPFLSLIVSGGHTLLILVEDFFKHKILGTTIDDAAGEAFDKTAKMLGLGYPGGPIIDEHAKKGNEEFHKFPKAHIKNSEYDFSFSGIKTSVLYFLEDIRYNEIKNNQLISDIAASFQKAVVISLYDKVMKAAKKYNIKNITVSGGVSANSYLKNVFFELRTKGYKVFIPELVYSTDNAAMIGITAYYKYLHTKDKNYFIKDSLSTRANPRMNFKSF